MMIAVFDKLASRTPRKATMPYTVECKGLTREHVGDEGFEQAVEEREAWKNANCVGDHSVEPVRDASGRLEGRRYLFADPNDAFHFRLRF